MLGVAVNVITVIIGSILGMLFRKGIPQKVNAAVMTGLGMCILYIGIDGAMAGENVLILIAAIVLGAITGTLLGIDKGVNKLGEMVEKKFSSPDKNVSIAQGFVTATLLFCIGSMTVTGSIQSGLTGDHTILFTKSTLDLVSATMLAASLGIGVLFSSASILVIQGGIVLLSGLISPFLDIGAINEMTCAGSILIMMIGTNMMGITKIKVADYLPAIIYAPIIYNLVPYIKSLFEMIF